MFKNYEITKVQLPSERNAQEKFLAEHDLRLEPDLEYSILVKDGENVVGTGSVSGEIFKCIAIDSSLRGEGLLGKIITNLIDFQHERGIYHNFVYTTPESGFYFRELGFSEIASTSEVALLEIGKPDIEEWLNSIKDQLPEIGETEVVGAIVVNCNPFSLGHRYLIETAAKDCDHLILFVVEEDRSFFPFEHRFDIVSEGVKDLENVLVFPSGKYIISNAVFPSYFIKDEDRDIVKIQTRLDITIFGARIATALGIKKRYVGTEPYCKTTEAYNIAMKSILNQHGVELIEIQRKSRDESIISASHIRKGIREDNWELVRKMTPDVTWDYLHSEKAKPILENIRNSSADEDKTPV